MKKLLAVALSACLVLSLTACGGSGTDEVVQNVSEDGTLSGTVTVWSWDVALAHLQSESVKFNELHPNVEFVFEEMGVEQVYSKMTTSLQSGIGLPDIVTLEGEQMAKFGIKFPDKFVEFTEDLNPEEYLPLKMAEVSIGDKIVAYPWDAGPAGIFYRQDLFDAAGIVVEDLITWDDFIEAGKVMKEKTGVSMLMMATTRSDLMYRFLMMELGGFYFDLDGNTTVNSPESIRGMQMVQDLYQADVIFNDSSWDDKMAAITGDKVACIPEAVWMAGSIKDIAPDQSGDWRVMPLPRFDADVPALSSSNGGSVLAVTTASKNIQASKEFIKYCMTSIEGNEEGFLNYGLYPSYIPALESPLFNEGDEYFGGQAIYSIFTEIAMNSPSVNYTENFAETLELTKAAISKATIGAEDVPTIMNDLQDEMVLKFGK